MNRAPLSNHLPLKQLLHKRYELMDVIGLGGFGITYKAQDQRLHRPVAVKELFLPDCTRRKTEVAIPRGLSSAAWHAAITCFLQEAQLLAGIRHAGVVEVYDVFEEHNTAYIIMQYVEGDNLEQMRRAQADLTPKRLLHYIYEAGDILRYLHGQSPAVIHGDIKPSNIIISPENRATLIDFGSAQRIIHNTLPTYYTDFTPGFTPPEYANPQAPLTVVADIYALAATCVWLLTGTLPGPEGPPANPPLPQVLIDSLAANPAARPGSMEEFLQALPLDMNLVSSADAPHMDFEDIVPTQRVSPPTPRKLGGGASTAPADPPTPRKPEGGGSTAPVESNTNNVVSGGPVISWNTSFQPQLPAVPLITPSDPPGSDSADDAHQAPKPGFIWKQLDKD